MKKRLIAAAASLLGCALLSASAFGQRADGGTRPNAANAVVQAPLKVEPSTVLADLRQTKQQKPETTARELAAQGNRLLAARGFNFNVDSCELADVNRPLADQPPNPNSISSFFYQLTKTDGEKSRFEIRDYDVGSPCGCVFSIAVLRINANEMLLPIASGAVAVKIPPEFVTEKYELVDRSLTKTLRKWIVPLDVEPLGISPDGTRIYTDVSYDDGLEPLTKLLAVEIAENGAFRFVAKIDARIVQREIALSNRPAQSDFDYKHFAANNRRYIVKYTPACT